MTATPVLEVSGLSYSFGKQRVLNNLEFQVAAGEFCVLLGANGAGKSTLLSLITRLYNSRGGSIKICGRDILKRPYLALKHLGAVFQQRSLDLDLTVWQNMKYAASLSGLANQQAYQLITKELRRMDMENKLHVKLRKLSGGQIRRVEIAGALMRSPALLVLDEATVGLDINSREAIIKHARNLCGNGAGILWATHLIDEIDKNDTLLILKKGEITKNGIAGDICNARDFKEFKASLIKLL